MASPTPSGADNDPNGNDRLRALAKYSGLGFQMLGIIGVFTYGGIKLDQYLHSSQPWATIVLTLTGVVGAMYQVIRSATQDM